MKKIKRQTKIIGRREYIDKETGEIIEAEVIVKDVASDTNFKKIWLSHILEAIDEVGNQKMKILFWMMDNVDTNNKIIATVRDIARYTKTGTATVQRLIRSLKKHNIISQKQNGVYIMNPQVIFKGSAGKRMNILFTYISSSSDEKSKSYDKSYDDDKNNHAPPEGGMDVRQRSNTHGFAMQDGKIDIIDIDEKVIEKIRKKLKNFRIKE